MVQARDKPGCTGSRGFMEKPQLSRRALFDLSVANMGSAVAFALVQGNMARIFQTLGADLDHLPILMIAGPVTGLLVQPLVGHFSDRTWRPDGLLSGRRRPYFLVGAVAAAAALLGMSLASSLTVAVLCFWILDTALNVVIEPFRAFVGDMVPAHQRARGLGLNAALGCVGAVVGFGLPFVLAHLHIANHAEPGAVPPSVRLALLLAGGILLAGVGWTVSHIREYSPAEQARFDGLPPPPAQPTPHRPPLGQIALDLWQMPKAMRQLASIHFFTWFALFIMWPFMTPVITQYAFHATDTASAAYNRGADYVGLLYAIQNVTAAAFGAMALPWLARRLGNGPAHALCLCTGVVSYLALVMLRQPALLALPFMGLGVAWASLLTLPFVMLTDALGGQRLGVYTGLFNLFVVLPQIGVSTVMGPVLRAWFPQEPIWAMLVAACSMSISVILTLALRPDRRDGLAEAAPSKG